jgi:CRISPR-associated protein Cas1
MKNKKLYIYKEDELIEEVPFFQLTAIVLNYNCDIDPSILKYTFEHGVSVFFIDGRFTFAGSIKHPESKNIFLRKKQYEAFSNSDFCLQHSKAVITGKIINCAKVIKLPKSNLNQWTDKVSKAKLPEELRGLEGSYANMYWKEFGSLLKNPDFTWSGRFKHPSYGEINSLLSWGYTLLSIEIQTFCEIIGLDPYLGFMHTEYYGRPSLVCDLQEEYRPWVVDKMVLNMINLGQIRKEHFKDENGIHRLTGEGYKIFHSEWIKRIKVDKKYKHIYDTGLAIRGVIEMQTRLFSKSILHEYEFKPYLA